MAEFADTPIPYVPIGTQAAAVRTAIDAPQLSAANSFGGLQKLAIPGPYATDAEANTFGVPDDNLYYRSDGTVRAASHISLDLAFALDKTLTARTGPTPTFSRASSGLFVNANGILVGKTEGTTLSLDPTSTTVGTTEVTVTVASGSVVGWLVGQSVSLIVDSNANNAPDTGELWLVGDIVSTTATQLVFRVTSKGSTSASATAWTLGYRGARFDHDATGVCKGLLIEESRTNLCLRSEELGGAVWSIFGSSISSDSVISPNGTVSADSLVENTSLSFHSVYQNLSVVGATVYTFSIYAKAGTREWISLAESTPNRRTFFNLSTGAIGQKNAAHTTSVQQLGNGWWRFAITFTAAASSASSPVAVELASADGVGSYLGNGSGNVFLWGAQLEAGAFPTSYIPTTSGTAIRGADVCSITGADFSSFYNQSEGTLFADATPQTVDQSILVVGMNVSTFQSGHFIYKGSSPNLSGAGKRWAGQTTVTSSPQTTIISATDIAIAQSKLIYGYKLNDMAFAANGALIGTDNTAAMPTSNAMRIGARDDGLQLNGHIARIQYFRKRLSNAKLQTLTAP